ncbi:piRNA biogenesis protein EXD1-like [Mizuhopecten yessoensis]|uniref:Exonuclease 3'-5' domain-containing protein 1 n=1 Tax=Mizuhopecten yessoensis TaxID=6573 RepID=A0A210QE94_MIZYE|nr:piRNA biogenesis protein EXD1-like [Mizuhopecten yessoensis]OWF47065.1 Exonuclease 3'-5' domain-containing protein 1 [Mizuhopecten yessoensis]
MAEFTGRRVKILLENGTDYEGFVHSMDQSVGKLTLEKVTIPSTGKKFQGLKHFFRDDLVSVDVLEEQIKSKKEEKKDFMVTDRRESGPRMMFSKYTPVHLDRLRSFDSKDKQLKRISSKEDLKSDSEQTVKLESKSSDNDSSDQDDRNSDDLFVVISKVGRKFDKVLREIYTQKIIGVALEGVCIGRSGTLCWLNIVIRQRVFLFDVLSMGKECFEEGLKDLLEDGSVLKVMHDCRLASDLLHHQFGVNLRNMFDTQVANAFVYRTFRGHGNWPRYVEGLQASLFDHLDLPQEQIQLMKVRAALKKEDQQVWMERPAGRPLLEAACKNVMHLLDLRLILMEKMMAEFVAGVDVYLAHTRDANNEEAKKHQSSGYLLPTAFKDLDRITSRNYGNYWRCTQKDTNGFNENCEGLADPDVIHSRDSLWHMGSKDNPGNSRFRGTMYMKKFENLRRMNSLEDKTAQSDETGQSGKLQQPSDEAPKKRKAPGPILYSSHSSTNTDSQSETESSKIPENTTNCSALNPATCSDVNQSTTGKLIRSLANKNGDISECDSLEGFSIRPAGVLERYNVDRRKKYKNQEVRSTSYYAGPPDHRENPAHGGYHSEKENMLSKGSPPQSLPELTVSPQLETRASLTYCNTEFTDHQGHETVSPQTTPVKKSPDTKKVSPLKALQNSLDSSNSRLEKMKLMCNALKNPN